MSRPFFVPLALSAVLAACSGSAATYLDSSGTSAESDGYGVTGGGYHLEPGAPATFFGTWSEPTARRYAYLVIARDLVPEGGPLEQTTDGGCASRGATLVSVDSLTVNGVTLRATSEARVGPDGLEAMSTTLNGLPTEQGQWLFLFDGDDPGSGLVPVQAEMPRLPMELSDLARFTNDHVAELARSNEAVGTFLGDR